MSSCSKKCNNPLVCLFLIKPKNKHVFTMYKVRCDHTWFTLLAAATKPAIQSVTTSPGTLKNNVKKEDGGKAEDSGLSSDQLVPDYAAGLVIGLIFFHVKQHHL